MNRFWNRMSGFGIIGAALILTAANAAAQQATFHLPFEAHWGMAVLQPGDYRLSAPENSLGRTEFYVRGQNMAAYALPLVAEEQPTSLRAYLVLVNVNGEYFVEQYSSGMAGKLFTFTIPKSARHESLAQRAGMVIPVKNTAVR